MGVKLKNIEADESSIPIGWQVVKIGDLFSFKNGLNKSKKYFGKGTPIINYMDVYKHRGLREFYIKGKVTVDKEETKNYAVEKGDVLFTRTSETVEEVGMTSILLDDVKDVVFSGFVLRGRPKSNLLDYKYCQYCFSEKSVRKQIVSKSTYTTRALTNGRLLSQVELIIPANQYEQAAIATALSDADRLITSLETLIDKKRKIKQGAMQELLTGRKRLLGFNREWVNIKLGEIAEICTGKKNNDDKVEDGIYPFFVRSQNIEHINSYAFDGEAILIPGEGNIGSIYHYINGKFNFHQRVYKVSNFNEYHSGKYIYYCMVQNFNAHAMKNTVKATVDSLRLPTFMGFELFVPSTKQEQIAIAVVLSDMDAEIESMEQKLAKYKLIKQGMMQELLTGKVRLV